MSSVETGWQESDSDLFIRYGDTITPSRQEQIELLLDLLPVGLEDACTFVDLACGAGSLTEALLERYQRSAVIALDGSPAMLEHTRQRAALFAGRLRTVQFDLRRSDWLAELPETVRCFVSSLALHHLDGQEKQRLFHQLVARLEPGGAIFIIDLIEPVNPRTARAYGNAWDAAVLAQSTDKPDQAEAYAVFQGGWNHFVTPDIEFDKPSRLFEQLQWLSAAGLSQIDCFWLRAGHALYGGYR